MRTLGVVVLGLALSGCAFQRAHAGTFYTTGKEFYESCWQRKTKDEAWKNAVAATPNEAALWASCSPMVVETMISIGFEISSSHEKAPAEMKALVGFCPNQWSELPMGPDRLYIPVIEIIEKTGGPSATENLAPASWIIQRALVARWPRCTGAARQSKYVAAFLRVNIADQECRYMGYNRREGGLQRYQKEVGVDERTAVAVVEATKLASDQKHNRSDLIPEVTQFVKAALPYFLQETDTEDFCTKVGGGLVKLGIMQRSQ
jgi:hypothetical protein